MRKTAGMRFERDLVGLERSLGLKSARGISRQSNKSSPPVQAIVNGMKKIAKEYVDLTTSEIRQSQALQQEVNDLFEEYAPVVWPDETIQQPEWLEDPDPYKFEGRYPRRLCYNDEEDRETLRALFYNLVVEKCCNYHSNQLQRARTSQRQSLDYLDSAGETPRKAEPGLGTESDSEMVDTGAAPQHLMNAFHDSTYEAREAQFTPGEFSFRVFQDYGMPSTDAGSGPTIKTTEPAPPPSTSAISWTPANMAPKEYTQEPTPSETATSDRPDRSMRPKRKRPQPNEEDLLPKKVSGDRKAKKPRWSQIIPLKVSPHHLARLADGERIAESVPTSPEEEEEVTPPPQDDTIMSNADDDQGASNGGSLSSVPPTPTEEVATDNENIVVKRDPRSATPASKPAPEQTAETEPQDAREPKSAIEHPPTDPPLSNGTSRPESNRPGSESAPPSRPATSHRESESSKPPPAALTAPPRKEPSMSELKWRPGPTKPLSQSPLVSANGLHTQQTGTPATTSPALSQDGFGGGRVHDREPDAVGGAARPVPQPAATSKPNSPRLDRHHMQNIPGPQRRESQQVPTQDPHAAHRSQLSLVEEVLGPMLDCPTAREVLRKTPNLSRAQLEDMRRILAHSADAQANIDVFYAHVHGRREDGPNGGSIATALASAVQPPNAPPFAGPPNTAIPKFPPQHVLPSNGPPNTGGPSPRLGAPAPSKRTSRPEDVDRILGELAACPTVKQVLQKKPDPRRRELRIMRDILRDHPQSRTDLEMLLTRLEARLEAADGQGERSPSQDHKERPPTAEPPRGVALPSPRVTPGQGNPFNAFDSNQYGRPQQQQQPSQQPPPQPAHAAEPRYSIVRSPPASEGSRRTETPHHSVEPNPGRQPLPPGAGAFRPAAPQTPADLPKPPLHPPAQAPPQRPPPHHLPSQPLQQPHPHPHQNVHPHPPGNFGPQHAHGPFGRLPPNVPSQPHAGPPHHPQHQHPQHNPMSAPAGPGRALIGQQDVFAVRPPPAQNEKDQHQRLAMPIRSTSMQSEPEVQTPQQHPGHAMSMSPTPGAVGGTNSLEDVSIEINWARNLDYSDYLSGDACLHCKTAGEFFSLIEAQMPDELQGVHGNGNRIKEVRIKALTRLQGEGNMPRIKRDEASGRPALRKLIKMLRSQPPDADIELQFLVVWE